ncbi:hypothetical protein RKD30_003378 [Streptomyces pristinaespiralis]
MTSAAKTNTPSVSLLPSARSAGRQVIVYDPSPRRADSPVPWILRDLTVRGLPLRSTWSISGSRPSSVSSGHTSAAVAPAGRGPKAAA